MGFFEDFGNTVIGIGTFGQCTGAGCGGDDKAYALGDSLSNFFTAGQCDGKGCGEGHTAKWAPIQTLFGDAENPLGPEDLQALAVYAGLGIGAIILINVVLDLLFKII